ncbi:hypothetical protein ACFQE8_21090 [Salinirubellus sp. GCM10025818]
MSNIVFTETHRDGNLLDNSSLVVALGVGTPMLFCLTVRGMLWAGPGGLK